MVHFANPGLLGTEKDFHRNYQNPILRGREPDATDKDRKKGEGKGVELGQLVNQFILRRTNTLLSDHLPPKLVCVVCCSLSKVQLDMYERFLKSKFAKQLENGGKQVCVMGERPHSQAPALQCTLQQATSTSLTTHTPLSPPPPSLSSLSSDTRPRVHHQPQEALQPSLPYHRPRAGR